jgi:hypothetical protein
VTPFWRREKPLHERLAEQGGMTAPFETGRDVAPWHNAGVHGIARPREWDAVVTVETEGTGNELAFVMLPDGTLLLESDNDVDLDPFADALVGSIEAPYRAIGIRKGAETWALAARAIQVAQLEDEIGGDTVELAVQADGESTVLVDGARTFGSLPSLEALAGGMAAYAIRADRLDDDLWEVKVAPL